MVTYSSRDARTKWRDVLDAVQAGETITVTRSGKVVARIVPVVDPLPMASSADAATVKVGDRWGDLTEGQRLGLPVGARMKWDDPDDGETITKIGRDSWRGKLGDLCDSELHEDNIITHIPATK